MFFHCDLVLVPVCGYQDIENSASRAQEDLEELRSELKALKQTKRGLEARVRELEEAGEALQQRLSREGDKVRRLEADRAQLQVQGEELTIKVPVQLEIYCGL